MQKENEKQTVEEPQKEEKKEETKEEKKDATTTEKKAPVVEVESSSSEEEDWGWGGSKNYFSKYRKPEMDPKKLWQEEEELTLEERRARYRCRKHYTLGEIYTWVNVSKKLKLVAKEKPLYSVNEEINSKIGYWHGDITTLEIDAIVNAANESCLGGGGVDGAIHSAAGDMLYEECRTLHGCPTGEAKITRGYNLPAKFVLHAVGPIGENSKMLTSAYRSCLELVLKHNIKSVAFCGISTGIFGYPLYKASHIALKVIREWLEENENYKKVDRIIICTFLEKEKFCYFDLLPLYFPLPDESSPAEETNEKKSANENTEKPTKETNVSE